MNQILDSVRPFVRYAQIITINDLVFFKNIAAYDFRIFYVRSGYGIITVNGEEYSVSHGSLLAFRPGVSYSLLSECDRELELIGLSFDLDFLNSERKTPIPPSKLENFEEARMLLPEGFSKDFPFYELICRHRAFEFESELLRIVSEYKNKLRYYEHKLSGRLLSIIADLFDKGERGAVSYKDSERIEKILSVIKENYSTPLSNEIIAEKLGYHKNHVNRLMVLYTGTSLHRYLQNYRLERAIELLETTSLPVSEIAYLVGFDDFSHFSKYFKKRVGYSPSEIRKTKGK